MISLKKIFQIDSFSGLGGGQRILFEIVKELRHEFDFLVIAPPGLFLEKYTQLGIKVQELKERNFIKIVRELRKIIEEKKPEILHLHGTRAATWARLAISGLKNRPKIIYTLHGFHLPRRSFLARPFLLSMERFLNRWTDILVCISEADKKLVLREKTILPEKIKVIKNGIDIERLRASQEEIQKVKEELNLENKFILSSIGRLHPPKDFSTILKALKLVISEIPNVKLLIIGDGPLRNSLEKETKELGLSEYVRFLGFREDIPTLINLSDVVIFSTKWEGFGLVSLETGVCRKPIIASEVGGLREIIIDGKTGILFKPGSAEDLAEKILKLYRSEELRKKIGENAFLFVSENFRIDKMIEKYRELYV